MLGAAGVAISPEVWEQELEGVKQAFWRNCVERSELWLLHEINGSIS